MACRMACVQIQVVFMACLVRQFMVGLFVLLFAAMPGQCCFLHVALSIQVCLHEQSDRGLAIPRKAQKYELPNS